jgi:ELWxxDGT repeat protein
MAVDIFTANNGLQLWRTDGTAAGATMLTTLPDAPSGFVDAAGVTYFTVAKPGQTDLWRTDGTAAGTFDLGSSLQSFTSLSSLGDRMFFIKAGAGLWTSDGTVAGTQPVFSAATAIVASINGDLFVDASQGGQSGLWSWNGVNGPVFLGAITIPVLGGFFATTNFISFDGKTFFTGNDGVHGNQLWSTDGTAAGTTMVTDVNPSGGGLSPFDFDIVGGRLLFVASANGSTEEIWSTDGTTAGTVELTAPGVAPDTVDGDGILTFGNRAYFSDGTALFATDGTVAGTTTAISNVSVFVENHLAEINGRFVMLGRFNNVPELAVSDGTTQGTTVIATGGLLGFTHAGGKLYFEFFPGDGPVGQLWISDGTVAGTHQFDNLVGEPIAAIGGDLLFFDANATPWITDGTAAGTHQVANFMASNFFPLASQVSARDEFFGDGRSDLLIENTAGSVVVGEVAGGQAGLSLVGGLGPEWSFKGAGDFLGDGKAGFLVENTAGSVVVGEVVNGQAALTLVSGLGPEWTFVGAGDFLGDHKDGFLIENTAGSVVVGEVANGQAGYTSVGGLGPEWKFVGAGDFLGDGKSDFLIENSAGSVVVGEVVNGQAALTLVLGLGPEWKFVGTGDFLGDGKRDFLIENSSGAVVVGEVAGGHANLTQIAGLGSEWKFVGSGDYFGEGHDQFLIENSSGAVVVGDWVNSQVHFTQVSALGSEWTFH